MQNESGEMFRDEMRKRETLFKCSVVLQWAVNQ